MESRSGRIARQLTHWVGGTIILLMLGFVLLDLGLQTVKFRRYHYEIAQQGAEGLRQLIQGRGSVEQAIELLREVSASTSYIEGRTRGFALFDLNGELIYASPLALSSNPEETAGLFTLPGGDAVTYDHREVAGTSVVVSAARYLTRSQPPEEGVAVYLVNATLHTQTAMLLWGWRSLIILLMIIGVMFAVRIPVRKFVLKPIDGLFVAAYAASKDDYRELPRCPVDNEFLDLYEMFDRLMSHLSDTRIVEATLVEEAESGQAPPPIDG